MTRTRAPRAEKLVLSLTIASILMVLLYDRSSYREKIIHKSKLPFIDWANVDLGNTTTSRSTLMDYFNWTNEQSCQQRHSMNGKGGRFSLCLDPSAALRNSSCLVYSFDFFDDLSFHSFENETKEQGCKVYHFDPVAVLEKHLIGNWTSRDDLEKSSRISRMKTHIGKMMPKTSVSIHWAMERLLDKVIHQEDRCQHFTVGANRGNTSSPLHSKNIPYI